MKSIWRVAALFTLLMAWAAPSAADDRQVYPLLEIYVVNHDDLRSDDNPAPGLRLGMGRSFAPPGSQVGPALELGLFANPIERHPLADDTQFGLTLEVLHTFDLGAFQPFLLGGVGAVHEPDATGGSALVPAVQAGAGVWLGRALRLSVSVQEVFNDELATTQDSFTDYRLSLGARFGAAGAPAAAPPADADGDGIPDTRDRCPRQPAATADGCPTAPVAAAQRERDTDGDGIPDSKDECPGTLAGLKVNASGCVTAASAQRIVLKGVNFLPGSTELTPEARAVLDEAAAALAGQTALRVEVGGHTDSRGDEALNLALSQRRADAVRHYLAGKGIAAGRLTAKGYGETQPIAENATRAGRQQNRRVELKILN